jgi:transmembrane sensor
MTEETLEPKLASARRAAPSWTLSRQQQAIWVVAGRLSARRRNLRKLAAGAALVSVLVAIWGLRGFHTSSSQLSFSSSSSQATSGQLDGSRWHLADGSEISIDGPSTEIQKTLDSKAEVAFELTAGGAQFDVARRPERVFRVHAGPVMVQVLGTKFGVQRRESRTSVIVERGRVLVSWAGGSRELSAGEMGIFPPPDAVALAEERSEPSSRRFEGKAAPSPSLHGEDGDRSTGPSALFARADRARAEGQPERALAPLRAITDLYPSDPRAPMAAFTRGRLLLESLGRPREAASAFAQARRLGARGTLAEDALAREVDALRAASDLRLAHERAELYRTLYPKGIRLRAVMRSGGLQGDP